jgi:hypothetical protein
VNVPSTFEKLPESLQQKLLALTDEQLAKSPEHLKTLVLEHRAKLADSQKADHVDVELNGRETNNTDLNSVVVAEDEPEDKPEVDLDLDDIDMDLGPCADIDGEDDERGEDEEQNTTEFDAVDVLPDSDDVADNDVVADELDLPFSKSPASRGELFGDDHGGEEDDGTRLGE